MNILLIDAYSAQHIGNLALVDSSLEQLRVQFPEAEFTILAFDPVSISKHSGCKTLETLWAEQFSSYSILKKIVWIIREGAWVLSNIFNFSVLKPMGFLINFEKYTFSKKKLAVLEAYSRADIVVSISGEALQDSQWKRIPFFLFGYWLSCSMEKITAIFPQSIGPFKNIFLKPIVNYVLNQCDLVLPRDGISFRVVQELGVDPKKVYLVPDMAVNQSYISSNQAQELLETEGVNLNKRPLVGMSISKWQNMEHNTYFLTMSKLCNFVIEELKGEIVFFVANRKFNQEIGDEELTRNLYDSLHSHSNATLISRIYTPAECKGMLGQLDLFISTRMHMSIFATMIGTPTITVNTQSKLQGYMDLIHQGSRACNIKDFTIKKAKELVKDSLAHNEQIRLSIKDAKNEIGKRAKMASELLAMVYDKKRK